MFIYRYSMFELREDEKKLTEKRRSLPSQFGPSAQKVSILIRNVLASESEIFVILIFFFFLQKMTDKETSYSEDEGVDSAGSHCDSPGPASDQDGKKLEYLLENAFHWNEDESAQLRNQVRITNFTYTRVG